MNIENMCILNKQNYTAKLILPEMKSAEDLKIPLSITMDETYLITDIEGFDKYDGKIFLSKYLKNKYKEPNIEYYDTNDPTSINRAWALANFSYKDIEKRINPIAFQKSCEQLLKEIMNYELCFLKNNLKLDNQLIEMCKEKMCKNGRYGVIERTIASMDLDERIIKPNIKRLSLDNFKTYQEFCLEIEKIYLENKDSMFSKECWDKNKKELYLKAKMSVKYYEKL